MQRLKQSVPGLLIDQIPKMTANPTYSIGGIELKCVASNIRRHLPWESYGLIEGQGKEGGLVVVEAVTGTGYRTEIETQEGHDTRISKGEKFVGVLANRHSGTSESGDIPRDGINITAGKELHLLAAGGIVGISSGMPARAGGPMKLKCLGLVANKQGPVNLMDLYGGHTQKLNPSAPIILVCGTSAEVGKTTTSAQLIKALVSRGLRVAGTKFSGTGRMRDIRSLRDAGAKPALDFPEAGLATTYTSPERFVPAIYALFNHLNDGKPDIIVAEAGGDLIEANIPTFLGTKRLAQPVKAAVVAAGDVMGMIGAVEYIRKYIPRLPIYLTDPKDRNSVTTRERISKELPGLTAFNSLNELEVSTICRRIVNNIGV